MQTTRAFPVLASKMKPVVHRVPPWLSVLSQSRCVPCPQSTRSYIGNTALGTVSLHHVHFFEVRRVAPPKAIALLPNSDLMAAPVLTGSLVNEAQIRLVNNIRGTTR